MERPLVGVQGLVAAAHGLRPAQPGYSQTDTSLSAPADWTEVPPTSVAHYVVEGELGRGGMGVVYRGRDTRLDRTVAIKSLPLVLANASRRARFEREAKLLALVNHPNIASIHAVEEVDSRYFLILEYVPGESLADLLARGPLPLDQALALASQLSLAMEAAHERGIVHRDLKPANLRVTPEGHFKVLDFGLAKDVSEVATDHAAEGLASSDPDRTAVGTAIGTVSYMSPEQLDAGTVDRRADIWAFGCILFEALSGARIWGQGTIEQRITAIRTSEPSWDLLPRETPDRVRRMLVRCLAKEPHQRLQRLSEAIEILAIVRAERAGSVEQKLLLGNLPRQFTSFVGRQTSIAEVVQLLAVSRLVTLIGPGGFGKTRLAYEVARHESQRFRDGTWVIDLAPLGNEAPIEPAVATVFGIKETVGVNLLDAIRDDLAGKSLLLVLDNCELLITRVTVLCRRLFDTCANVTILATSRIPLEVAGETRYPLQPLSTPGSATLDADNEAVQLFVERARTAMPGFTIGDANASVIADLCRQLAGIPLAIEIAASRLRTLSLDQLAQRLAHRIAGLRPMGGGTRRETLREAIDWSYQNLEVSEQTLLRRLAVFCRSFDLEAAEDVCSAEPLDPACVLDCLTELVDKALVAVEKRGAEVRYRLLEIVREYLIEQLEAIGESDLITARHLNFYRQLAEQAEEPLLSPDREFWMERLEEERDNLRAALRAARDRPEWSEQGLRLAAASERFWIQRSSPRHEYELLEQLLTITTDQQSESYQRALCCAGYWSHFLDDLAQAAGIYQRALSLADSLGSRTGRARALHGLALVAVRRGELRDAQSHLEEELALRRELRQPRAENAALSMLSTVALRAGDLLAARSYRQASIERSRSLGDDSLLALDLSNFAVIALDQGEVAEAQRYLEESLRLRLRLRDERGALRTRLNIALIAVRRNDLQLGGEMCVAGLEEARRLEDREATATCLNNLGAIALKTGEFAKAREYVLEALALSRKMDDQILIVNLLENLARVEIGLGRRREALIILGATAAERARRDMLRTPDDLAEHERDLEHLRADLSSAVVDQLLAEGAERKLAEFGER